MGDESSSDKAADAAMERYASGDDAAFAELYDLLAHRLYGYLVRRTGDRALAEDLVQQTLLHMHRARGSFLRGAAVLPWALAIARRLVIDTFRRERRQVPTTRDDEMLPSVVADAPTAHEILEAAELAEQLRGALAALPEPQRVAFELLKQDGLSVSDAAALLGTTEGAVKLRAFRAYEALRTVVARNSETRAATRRT